MGHSCRSSERLWMIYLLAKRLINDKDTLLEVPVSYVWTSREPGAVSINKVPFINSCPELGSATWVSSPLCESVSLLERVLPMWWTSSGFIIWIPSPQQSPSPQRTVSLQRLRLKGSDCRLLRASPTGGFPSASAWLSHHGSPTFDNEFVERESPLQKDYLNR